jgi:hypothetical protein
MIIIVLLILCSTVGVAQEYAEFHGTWIHSKVVEVLNESRSIERALAARPVHEPIYVVIDSANTDGNVTLAYNLGKSEVMVCRKSSFKHAGIKWGIGDQTGPLWILTRDEKARSYIALTPVDSLEQAPIVLGKLPSKNPDPVFIIRRMVNASMLTGRWSSAKNKIVEFTTNQLMVTDGAPKPYTLDISADGATVTLITTSGQPQKWIVRRDGPELVLTSVATKPKKRSKFEVPEIRLRYLGK